MIRFFQHLMVAVLLGCGLFITSCNSKEQQLKAAIEAINRQYPMQIADGAVLEGFFVNEKNLDIAVTQQEAYVTQAITDERMEELKSDFKFYFAMAVREDNNMRDMFQLIADNEMTISVSVTLQPSTKRFSTQLSKEDVKNILRVNATK